MPELPEVETVRRGLAATIRASTIEAVHVRETRLRQPVDRVAIRRMIGARFGDFARIGKYLLLGTDGKTSLLVHLGMSGTLRVVEPAAELHPHDHVIWSLRTADRARVDLRYRDPRRFGLVLAIESVSASEHPLLRDLGPDPTAGLDPGYLYSRSRGVRRAVKAFLMDARTVVGIGNIYASESLWWARVDPRVKAGRIARARWDRLQESCVRVLEHAVQQGGTTLNDFRSSSGSPGYFEVELRAYGREGVACSRCGRPIRRIVVQGRSTFLCTGCQH